MIKTYLKGISESASTKSVFCVVETEVEELGGVRSQIAKGYVKKTDKVQVGSEILVPEGILVEEYQSKEAQTTNGDPVSMLRFVQEKLAK